MKYEEFESYVGLLKEGPFALYPLPKGFNSEHNKLTFVALDLTHVKVKQSSSGEEFLVPLALVEFANPGVLRMIRDVKVLNFSFV